MSVSKSTTLRVVAVASLIAGLVACSDSDRASDHGGQGGEAGAAAAGGASGASAQAGSGGAGGGGGSGAGGGGGSGAGGGGGAGQAGGGAGGTAGAGQTGGAGGLAGSGAGGQAGDGSAARGGTGGAPSQCAMLGDRCCAPQGSDGLRFCDGGLICGADFTCVACTAERTTGCASTQPDGGVACCNGLVCCEGVPYDLAGECHSECLLESDRSIKADIRPADTHALLESVARLPIHSWRYRQQPEAEHVGPMAQDFAAALGLGADDRVIAAVDANGVALGAIQALHEKVERLIQQNEALVERVAELEDAAGRSQRPGCSPAKPSAPHPEP